MPVSTERMQKLHQMLQQEPRDTFLLYGLAMEYRKAGNLVEALRYLGQVIGIDPGYCVAYQQAGQIHEAMGDLESASKAYRDGIASARQKGDHHAAEEMQAALSMIG